MGINGSHNYTHSITGVSIGEIYQIALARRKKKVESTPNNANKNNDLTPTIDVDTSWVYRSSGACIETRMSWLIGLSIDLMQIGFIVYFVCDGDRRHHSKRATVHRKSQARKFIIDGYLKRCELMKLAEKRNECECLEEINIIINQENVLSKKIRSMEDVQQRSNLDVGKDFFYELNKHINNLDDKDKGKRNGNVFAIKAKYQADSVIAYRCINGDSDIVFSADSDIVFSADSDLAAHAGNHCVGIKSFKFNHRSRGERLSNMVIYTPSYSALIQVSESISLQSTSDRIKYSEYPFFDNVGDIKIRGLLAVGLGCDVFLPGVKDMGKATLNKFIEQCEALSYESILEFYYNHYTKKYNNKRKKNIENTNDDADNIICKDDYFDAFNTYVDTFIYEPSNFSKDIESDNNSFDIDNNEKALYFTNQKPQRLHEYIEDFSNNDPDIIIYSTNNKLMECCGSGSGVHIFLTFEEHHQCCFCANTFCNYCCIKHESQQSCFDCYLSEVAVMPTNITNQPTTINNMRNQLTMLGIETTNQDNVGDISDLFEAIVEKKEFDMYTTNTFINEVSLPLYPSIYLDSEKILFRFDLKDGGSFIRHECCTLNNKVDIVCLLSKLVQSGNPQYKEKNKTIQSILPDLIVDFAKRSRLHSGFRLLKRALRHAMDPNGCNILTSNCCIINYNNTIGLHILHKIRASMKKDVYDVKLSFTSTDIISCKCSCKAGGNDDDKIICVHILPVILQLSILLYDGLAEHVLVELSNDINAEDEKSLSEESKKNLKSAIILLKRANSDVNNDYLLNNNISVCDLLHHYNVGTELSKMGPGPPTSTKALGPLRNLSFMSPFLMVQNAYTKKQSNNMSINNTLSSNLNNTVEDIPYSIINNLIKLTKNNFRTTSIKSLQLEHCLGYKIVEHRAAKEEPLNTKTINVLKKKLLVAFNNACNEFRKSNTSMNNNNLSGNENDITETEIFTQEIIDSVNENDNNDNSLVLINQDINNFTTAKNKKSRFTCCACVNTSTKAPSLSFHRVPPTPRNKINEHSSDNMRKTYYRKLFQRKEWLTRFGLSANNAKQSLVFCSEHVLELQNTQFKWKDKFNNEILTEQKIRLPRKLNEPPIKTRQQREKREIIDLNCIALSSKKQKQNHINIPSNTTNVQNNKRPRHYCSYKGCRVVDFNKTNQSTNKFFRVPKMPPALKENAPNYQLMQHAKKVEYRKLFCKTIGMNIKNERKDVRICEFHNIQTVKSLVIYKNRKGIQQSTRVKFDLPAESSVNKTNTTRESKGLGIDRLICNKLNAAKTINETTAVNDNSDWAFALQQTVAMIDGPHLVHPSVAKTVGMTIHETNNIQYKRPSKPIFEKEKTLVRLNLLSDLDIKSQTGFDSKSSLISFIIILCNGCIDTMTSTMTKLTWFEEWFFFLEKTYGRGISRWINYQSKYNRSESILRQLFDKKLKIAIDCRNRWPKYASLEEDEVFRKEHWNQTYEGKRVVMWDNTNIRLPKPQDAEAQRNTYSVYYAGNVGKGAVFIQLCGWMGTHELWMGAVSDSEYFERSGILEQQQQYLKQEDITSSNVPWMNILDKGYRVTSAAWRSGGQFVLQPTFAKSDKKFTATETLRSAAIAYDRSANERAVRLAKMCMPLHDGRTGNKSIERLSDLWLTWSLECNFLYKPVL